MKHYDVLESRQLFRGRVFGLRQDRVRLPDGQTASLDIIEHGGAAVIVPVDEQGRIWFVRQYRHAAGEALLELPAGTLEPGEPPAACAAREVREEIGMAAGTIEPLGGSFLAPGYSSEFLHYFLARELTPDPAPHDADEFLEVVQLPAAEAYRLAAAGLIRDGKTLAGLLLAQSRL
ncbi:MAG: NUDIX hydrolase [Chloroflexi bacterium]|nr:NUDIX hydrolase [Chloroflexota bacterium]